MILDLWSACYAALFRGNIGLGGLLITASREGTIVPSLCVFSHLYSHSWLPLSSWSESFCLASSPHSCLTVALAQGTRCVKHSRSGRRHAINPHHASGKVSASTLAFPFDEPTTFTEIESVVQS
ncbi:hypothetical protein BDN67DRAFT_966884 [Paxillus ammoniavirescens]|nr:hypothetical protein BDN67DRAFT_966884 [Paxillus ammoniavirescens]